MKALFLQNIILWAVWLTVSTITEAKVIEQPDNFHFYAEVKLLAQPWQTIQEIEADFPFLLSEAGVKGNFDKNAVRIYAVSPEGKLLSDAVPYRQEGKRLIFPVVAEAQDKNATKIYRVYFDIKENGLKPPLKTSCGIGEPNLVPNPGFEQEDESGIPAKVPYFKVYKNCFKLDSQEFHSGQKSIMITAARPAKFKNWTLMITPHPGPANVAMRTTPSAYKFSVWVKGKGCDPGGRVLYAVGTWWSKEKGLYTYSKTTVGSIIGKTDFAWTKLEKTQSVMPWAENIYFVLFLTSKQGTVWVDDPKITLQNIPKLDFLMFNNKIAKKEVN